MKPPFAKNIVRETDPLVAWLRRELLPAIEESFAPQRLVVFRLPARIEQAAQRPAGMLVVSHRFEGVPVAERNALVTTLTDSVLPVRPICLTPSEFAVSAQVPGPVVEAMRAGYSLISP